MACLQWMDWEAAWGSVSQMGCPWECALGCPLEWVVGYPEGKGEG